ncbi:phosphatidate phosphatase PAH1-like [Salvia miltiorrhiza]|uniref:phosphatidate phosphatase PAH1-like n=1 Tax=Salvia miltiorrhiza TaxID=226208 RepID=UPI0025AC8DF1|nr:phosphatidate phosphatase PAH1-like [Salvia miltiorrhiza]XP_057801404.1 phosphatidate phosphatase PAH1-like [Salvia miltiorrhiza]XP_057801405.1 phosphatidate phosphatase PAH1-like [Salvia miltiorrhiza]
MNVVGRVSSFITQGVYSVATPFHPFGGAVDIIVVKQNDGTFRSTPWYVRFGKFQGVLKGAEKVVRIEVNGVEANFHMHLDNSGEAYFVREVDADKDDREGIKDSDSLEGGREDNSSVYSNAESSPKENDFFGQEIDDFNSGEVEMRDLRTTLGMKRLERVESDSERIFYEFQDEQSSLDGSVEFSEYGSGRYDNLDSVEHSLEESENSSSEVVLVSVDGHILMAPISSIVTDAASVQLSTPQFHLGPGERTQEFNGDDDSWTTNYMAELDSPTDEIASGNNCNGNKDPQSSEHLEPRQSDGERLYHVQESLDSSNPDKEPSVESGSESTSGSLNKRDVFKSCLEFMELSQQSTNEDQEDICLSEDQKSPLSPSMNDESVEQNLEISRDNGESGNPSSVSLPESQVEAVPHERNTSNSDLDGFDRMRVQFVSVDQESGKQVEVDRTVGTMNDGRESPSDVCREKDCVEPQTAASTGYKNLDISLGLEISLCGKLLHAGMGSSAAQDAFNAKRISLEEFKLSPASVVNNEDLIVRIQGKYLPWHKAAHVVLGMAAFGVDLPVEPHDAIPVEQEKPETKEDDSQLTPIPSRRWRLWPIPFRRVKTLEHATSYSSNEEVYVDSDSGSQSQQAVMTPTARTASESPRKQFIRTNAPTTEQIASLNLKEGQNMVSFKFSTRVLGSQKVEAHIYLWKWNTRIVISDVDGTITKSDVLGQFMPLVGKDWTHSGIAHLFSAIKENGYQLLFLSARAIVQAYLTKSFLFNLKQDGKSLPNGPVVISPDGLFPSLYREVIRRAPHEFKIACLEDIKALFPPDYNPFYAGFGNRDTDELSYRKIGIPKGKIFIINPKGEVAINRRIDVKSYTSLHTLVNDMFPPTSLIEQEDYNSWNYWKVPLPDVDNL